MASRRRRDVSRRDVSRSDPSASRREDRRLFDDPLLDRMFSQSLLVDDRVIRSLEDRRTYHPAGPLRPAASFVRSDARLRAKSSAVAALRNDAPDRVGFDVPERVAVCVRRHQRREVLHALRKTGGGVSRVRRRNFWSDVDC